MTAAAGEAGARLQQLHRADGTLESVGNRVSVDQACIEELTEPCGKFIRNLDFRVDCNHASDAELEEDFSDFLHEHSLLQSGRRSKKSL